MTSLNESILNNSLLLAQQQLQGFAQSENFWTVFDSVFGTEYDHAQAAAIQQVWQVGDFSLLPEIEVLDGASMPGIQGGFSAQTGRIYINADFLEKTTAEQISLVLLEEIGHWLDNQVNTIDTPGDEGELFAAVITNQSLNEQQLAVLRNENDFGYITVNGELQPIESSTVVETEPNNIFSQAVNLNQFSWSLNYSPDIGDTVSNTSTTIPHLTIQGTGDGSYDYYKLSINTPGSKAIFDIDNGMPDVDIYLRLYDVNGVLIFSNDDTSTTYGQSGSIHGYDPYLEYTFSNDGTYYLKVSKYPDDPLPVGSDYTLNVSLNTPPTLAFNSITAVNENGIAVLSGTITDPGTLDTFSLNINWGDGNTQSINLNNPPAGVTWNAATRQFSIQHQYLDDNPSGTLSDTYNISAIVTDNGGASSSASRMVTVNNVFPTLTLNPITAINENGIAILSGTITDPGTLDTFVLNINWGDDNTQSINLNNPPAGVTWNAATRQFSIQHQYLDDNPSGTASDRYNISATVTDDDGGTGSTSNRVQLPIAWSGDVTSNDFNSASSQQFAPVTSSQIIFKDSDTYAIAHDHGGGNGPTNVYIDVYNTTQNQWVQVFSQSIPDGSQFSFNNLSISFASQTFNQVRLRSDPGQHQTFHGFGDTSIETTGNGVVVTVNNVAPTANAGVDQTANEGGIVSFSGSATDRGTLDTFTYAWDLDGNGTYETIGQNVSRVFRDNGTYTVGLQVTDDDGGVSTDTLQVTVNNVAPIFGNGTTASNITELSDSSTNENNFEHTASGVLSFADAGFNDTHSVTVTPTGSDYLGTLTASIADPATSDGSGSIAWNFSVPDAALDSLSSGQTINQIYTLTLQDDDGGTLTQTLSINLIGTNDAPSVIGTQATLAAGIEDTTYIISASDLLQGFSDVDGDTLSVANLAATHGTLAYNNGGTWNFTANANFNGVVSLSYNVLDSNGGSVAATQSFTINAVNDVPTGSSTVTLINGTEDTTYTINAADLLQGFSDVDGDTLSVSDLTASNGTLVDNDNGTYTFTPNANFNGAVNLSYNVIDGNGGSVAATQSFTVDAVNDVPTGSSSVTLINGTEDTTYTINAADLLQGFSDVDGDTLSVFGLTASNGSLVKNNNDTYTFTPAANFNGTVNLSYNVVDGNGGSIAATQSITIASVNDAPVVSNAIADVSTLEDSPFTFVIPTNTFSDVDGDALTYTATLETGADLPSWLTFDGTTFSGIPTNDNVGSLNIKLTASDGQASVSNVFNLAIANTNDTPTATNDSLTTAEDVPLIISAASLLGNDADVDLGDSLSIAAVTQPSEGGLVDNGDGTYTYTPNTNYNGTDSFTYTISDRDGATSTATINLTINAVNDNPDAINDTVTARQSTPKTILAADLLANDTDIEGNTLSLTNVSNAQNGTVALDSNGNVVFTANANVSTASFEYMLSDGNGGTDSAIVTVLVGTTQDGGNGRDILNGTAGDDMLNGGNGDDILLGLAGDDILSGGNGMDNLQGGEGEDRLYGGRGNDLLTGGLGSDIFVLIAQNGTDTIQDFADGEDKIGLAGELTFGQLSISSSNGNTLISKNGGEVLAILTDVNSSLITQADFISVM